MISTINEALDYIYSFINLEKTAAKYKSKEYSLDNIKKILVHFNNPEKSLNIFHVAGTKGKGSTSFFITYLLNELSLKTTTFLSPHLAKPNERIMSGLDLISDKDIIRLTKKIKEEIEKNNFIPTTFEFFFILFLLFSKKKHPDYSIIETGLGGRLDTTNVVDPVVSVITPISYDHTNVLGRKISGIAFEKAGIIKPFRKAVLSNQPYKCNDIFIKKAEENNCRLFTVGEYFKLLKFMPNGKGIVFDFKFKNKRINDFFLPLFGIHQINNFFTALLGVYLVRPEIIDLISDKKNIDLRIPGRIELLKDDPPLILDVAHNSDSAEKLKSTLLLHFPGIKWNILSGMSADKDYKGFYRELKKISKKVIITEPSYYKKSEPYKVFLSAKSIIKNTEYIKDFNKAFNKAVGLKEPLLVTGSFYIAGPFLELWGQSFNSDEKNHPLND
jgi:dihydrofolate synthase/folylpolyglutamate synthase